MAKRLRTVNVRDAEIELRDTGECIRGIRMYCKVLKPKYVVLKCIEWYFEHVAVLKRCSDTLKVS